MDAGEAQETSAQSTYTFNAPLVDSGSSSDGDSALGSGASISASTAVSSRIYEFRLEHGRRYHALHSDAEYNLPNDEEEMDRLDLQHHLFRLTLDGALYKAPLPPDVHHVLDVGTGSGIWALDFAEEHPSAAVIGTDLSPVQLPHAPPNLRFYVENVEQDWNFDHDFDMIHARMLVVALKDWPNFFRQAFAHLKPGGWLEMQDLLSPMPRCDDNSAPPDSPLMVWAQLMRMASQRTGIDLEAANRFPQLMRAAGFVDVQVQTEIWPLNRWPMDEKMKERGKWASENLTMGVEGISMGFFTKVLGWSEADVKELVDQVQAQIRDRSNHTYMPVVFVWARKPE
ncbi:uncharacterized protein PV09_00865 [Verruconis gallopava]|uniref:Methyltransferase domain-containing protein n=1 Tax=Verruconis gallopava TaxID=253628 RepID=A0A0D2AQL4_9PEZI|nr:uncharacterized protein PV09_00865 [Verruconis gallopava]KIW08953.1 hypothetical protein PV09_00865 [Verruconis gallopava]